MKGEVILVIKNTKGVFGFIKCDGHPNYYYDTASIIKGNYLRKGDFVEFEIKYLGQGKTKAVDVKKVIPDVQIRFLDSDKKENLNARFKAIISESGFVQFTQIIKILKSVGINYKEYAPDISSFISRNLGSDFEIKKPFIINGKTYPAVIVKADKELSEENRIKIRRKLLTVVRGNGFFPARMFPEYLQELGISKFQDYASGLDEFLDKYVPGVFVPVKDAVFDGKVYSKVYVFDKEFDKEETCIGEALITLNEILTQHIQENGFFLTSEFLSEAKKCGIENFREYANSVEAFVDIYLHNLEVKKNVVIGDIKYPGIIVIRDESREVSNLEYKLVSSQYEEDLIRLRDFFDSGQYEAFLFSDAFERINPNNLPIDFMEMALNCAFTILFPGEDKKISLNLFQRELFINATSLEFIKKWKSFEGFSKDIMQMCAETAIVSFDMPADQGLVVKLLNNIGYTSTLNNNYVGLTKRFSSCENELIPCLYLIRAFVQKSPGAIQRCISEYCQLVKDIKRSSSNRKINEVEKLIAFPHVIKSINNYVLPLENLPRNLKTNIISVFVEFDELEELQQLLPILDPEGISVEGRLVNFYFNYEEYEEKEMVDILENNVSLQLFQKVIALIWEKHSDSSELPSQLIRILSWIIIYSNYYSVDEILRYHFTAGFTKQQKQIMLMDSFEKICEMIQNEPGIYSLASYIDLIVAQDLNANCISEGALAQLERWSTLSQTFFDVMVQDIGDINLDNSQRYIKLFSLFKLDYTHYLKVQKTYADWFEKSSILTGRDVDEIACILDKLFDKNAFETYSRVFQMLDTNYISAERIEKYVISLVEMQRYADAILFIQVNTNVAIEKRNGLLSMVITENFRINEMSAKAFSIFGESFSTDDAISVLLSSVKPNQYGAVSSLIALYCHLEEYNKAMYLYVIYQSKSENGFTRLYSKIRGILKSVLLKVHNHYDVVELVFYTLIPNKVIGFLEWTRLIRIPDMKSYVPVHAFSRFYDVLMEEPRSEIGWNSFLSHMVKRLDRNAWMIFVCEMILRSELDIYVSDNSLFALKNILANVTVENVPYNLLPYSYLYIMQSGNIEVCTMVTEILKNPDMVEKLVKKNIWDTSYNGIKDDFKSYCMESYSKTNADVFYHIIPLIGADLSVNDLGELAKSNANKDYLFAEICNNYLLECNWSETVELLNSFDWCNLSKMDEEVLDILRLIYSDDDNLLLDSNGLFETEEDVQRFKRECANILKTYPSKEGLFEFETNCNNTEHKLKVYAYVFEAIYDQDIYDRYKLHFSDLDTPNLYHSFLLFLKKAFYAQLDWNTSYLFLYKKWRYLKLLINSVLINTDVNVDTTDIVSVMEANSHYDEIYQSIFVPFKNELTVFWGFENFSVEEKSAFLFALMQGEMGDFIVHFGEVFKKTTDLQKRTLKKLLSYLDYREASSSIYQLFFEEIKTGCFENAKSAADSICDYAYDALVNMEKMQSDPNSIVLFEKIACQLAGANCVNTAFRMEEFEKYSMFLIPLVCSKQFIFHMYGRIRRAVIEGDKFSLLSKFKLVANYLKDRNCFDAAIVYNYLFALRLCIDKDREGLKTFISFHDIKSRIPAQWINEMSRICQYADNDIDHFIPDSSIKDYSRDKIQQESDFSFVKRLQEQHQIQEESLSIDGAVELYQKFNTIELSIWERVNSGLMLLLNYPELNKSMQREGGIPSKKDLILKVGVMAITPEANTPVNEQMAILTELFENRSQFMSKKAKTDLDLLKDGFANVLNKSFPLYLWIRYADDIEKYLRETHNLLDFPELKNRIILSARELIDENISQNDRYKGFFELMNSFNGLESIYSRNVLEAIRGECRQIENSVRLNVEIVNQNRVITDGHIYFQIENIGKRTVSLSGDDIVVLFKQENQPEKEVIVRNVSNLQSGFITGGSESVHFSKSEKSIQVSISLKMKLPSGKMELLCSKSEELYVENNPKEFHVTPMTRYIVDSAVTDSDMLFGRQNLQDKLTMIIPKGVSVIYGPSRIGKTSLLNWVRKDLAKHNGNVISILFGGEHGLGKGKDYSMKFFDSKIPVPYGDDEKMSEYLLADTIIQTFNKKSRRLRKPDGCNISQMLCDNIVHIMGDDSLSLGDRFYELDWVLAKENFELWILLDEFQNVVSEWQPAKNCDFVEICQMLLNSDPDDGIHNIKLVVCGSDDLLRHMVLEDHSVWKEAFPKSTRVAVEPLLEKPFCNMIRQDVQIIDANIEYSDSALKALFVYTDGVALYGKEIGNAIIDDINSRPELYCGRNTIYVSDVANATQKLINQQADELNTQAKEGISEIYDAVTKNLDKDTDMQYLWYMAVWLHMNPEEDGFKESLFTQRTLLNGTQSLKDSLSIAEARGIIKNKNNKFEPVWVFRALFYYFAFLGSASGGNLREDLIFDKEEEHIESDENPYTTDRIAEYFEKMSGTAQARLIGALAGSAKNEAQEKMKNLVGDNKTVEGDEVSGGKMVSNVQVNIQSITNTLNGILAAGTNDSQLLEGIQALPRLGDYLPYTSDFSEMSEERIFRAMENYVIDMEESLETSYEQSDIKEEEIRYHEILKITETEFEEFMEQYNLPEFFLNSLKFAYRLEQLFMKGAVGDNIESIDFSPVTIMYCKLIESMLKEYHIEVYSRCLPDIQTDMIKPEDKCQKYNWGEIGGLPLQQQQMLTIGSFLRPLYKARAIRNIIWMTHQTEEEWETHKKMIAVVKDIRNLSAHGNKEHRISLKQKETLTRILFDNHEFIRLIELALG